MVVVAVQAVEVAVEVAVLDCVAGHFELRIGREDRSVGNVGLDADVDLERAQCAPQGLAGHPQHVLREQLHAVLAIEGGRLVHRLFAHLALHDRVANELVARFHSRVHQREPGAR